MEKNILKTRYAICFVVNRAFNVKFLAVFNQKYFLPAVPISGSDVAAAVRRGYEAEPGKAGGQQRVRQAEEPASPQAPPGKFKPEKLSYDLQRGNLCIRKPALSCCRKHGSCVSGRV
jgi:hypothetical protein